MFSYRNDRVLYHLEFILIVDLLHAGPEFLGQVEAFGHVFRRHKVIDYLNTAVEVLYLKTGTGRSQQQPHISFKKNILSNISVTHERKHLKCIG